MSTLAGVGEYTPFVNEMQNENSGYTKKLASRRAGAANSSASAAIPYFDQAAQHTWLDGEINLPPMRRMCPIWPICFADTKPLAQAADVAAIFPSRE
jgi:hypothetical protein